MHIKPAVLGANVIGGLIFGVGMAVLGYCPGTGAAALGDGSRHAIPGLIGMMVGGVVFAELYPWLSKNVLTWADTIVTVNGKATDKLTLPDVAGVSPWWFILALAALAGVIFVLLESSGRNRQELVA